MRRLARKTLIATYFVFLAGIGVVLGCYIHGARVNHGTLMSGVAFVRELPYGEGVVGWTETMVFGYQEKRHLEEYKKKHKIVIDPKVLEEQQRLYK